MTTGYCRPVPAAYRTRLQLEGGVLAAVGLTASAALVTRAPQARRWPAFTAAQLALLTAVLLKRGPATWTAWMEKATPVGDQELTGEPTPLAHLPVPMLVGALVVKGSERLPGPLSGLAGWDAALRVTAGSAIVGAVQALVMARAVAAAEAEQGRVYHRLPGSRLGSGTKLGYMER